MKIKAPFSIQIMNPRKKCSVAWVRGHQLCKYGWVQDWPLQLFFWWKGKGTRP